MTEQQNQLKTNHNVRVVTISTGEKILCLFGEVKSEDNTEVLGYRLMYPFVLSLGEQNEDGSMQVKYSKWCPYSPVQEHRISGSHIISVVFPDNTILQNYTDELISFGFTEDQLFYTEETLADGDNSESTETGE
jgi:hypothetical protein